ncbi:replication initiator protein A [Novosphingobium sp. SG751A]|uniref:replication initiator protein A n=1 Tax=Novosphingobium sp. SG751A TaxID=2587000 RepID=UPI0020A62F97|nr:replication initiator protein A [Novosphingobium sp. SG751A]
MSDEPVSSLPSGRRVQMEMFFTLPDFSDISLRDYQETMQRPFFSLSKKKRLKPIEYVSPDKSVTVHVSANPAYGMATIWDADIMIYLASHLNELRERGENDISPTIRVQPGDMLKRICWGVSGRAYERLLQALDRLQATTIKTNLRANSKSRETTFSWIDSYTHLVDERTQRSLGMEITLSKWFFDGVMDKRNVLAISPLYFEITSGLAKWLYRASRKHAGGNGAEGFTIGFETLHQKSGSESSLPSFKNKILELARANNMPEINLEVIGAETPRPKLKMVMRRYLEDGAAKVAETPPSPPPSRKPAVKAPDEADYVDPAMARSLIARTITDLASNKDEECRPRKASAPYGRAQRVLDAEIYQAIRAECPGWDLDVLMQQFDAFLNANPDELPRNYSKRFYGFVKRHHERNKFQLPGN